MSIGRYQNVLIQKEEIIQYCFEQQKSVLEVLLSTISFQCEHPIFSSAIGGGETWILLDIQNIQRVLWFCNHVSVVTRLQVLQVFIDHSGVICVQKIVADMRKVIAYHPEIEQRRLHRRVFFDYVNSENLALMVSFLSSTLRNRTFVIIVFLLLVIGACLRQLCSVFLCRKKDLFRVLD